MKKTLVLILAVVLLLTACSGGKVAASAKAVSVGKQAVETIDAYLDGSLSGKDANEKLSDLGRQLEYTGEYAGKKMSDQESADWFIKVDIDLANHEIIMDAYKGSPETFDKIAEKRNEIAERVGVSKR